MDLVHCNRCFKRNPVGGYYISSCFHIFCQKCTESDHTHCSMCKKGVKIVKLNGNISQGIKVYFTDPLKFFGEIMEKLQRKMDFQSNIRVHLVKHLSKEKEKKRQMEQYFRKKGQEFESQKKKLAEANTWILTAERKLKAGEEERQRLQIEVEQLQNALQQTACTSQQPAIPPFSFMMADSDDLGRGSSLVNSSPNSTFNMVSPLVTSPARSLNDTNYQNFFNETVVGNGGGNGDLLGDDTMFATVSTSNSHQRSALSDTTAFSATFNNMFTPVKDVEMTMVGDKTSHSLDNWKTSRMEAISGLDLTRRETSLPTSTPLPLPQSSTHRSSHQSHLHRNPSTASTSTTRRHLPPSAAPPPGAIRDIRRYSSQPGYLAHRKSLNRSGNSSGNGSGGASFHEPEGLF